MEMDTSKWDFVDYTPVDLAKMVFDKSMFSKKEEVKKSDDDLDVGDYNVEEEISNRKMTYPWPHDSKYGGQRHALLK